MTNRNLAPGGLMLLVLAGGIAWMKGSPSKAVSRSKAAEEIKLITLDPSHSHAAAIQNEMYPGVSRKVDVYAPLGADLIEHLNRIARFNERKKNPTSWELEIHTGPDFLERMVKERPGNVVVISGRNQEKIEQIQASVKAGLSVLADKPWITTAADFPKLEAALNEAQRKRLITYDLMTERFEITTILQRELVNDSVTFGTILRGTPADPSVYIESVHHIMKRTNGAPNLRPAWFFDINQQGEGFADVGTHFVDLAQWTLFPEQVIDYRKDIQVLGGKRWPTFVTLTEFQQVTGESDFPANFAVHVKGDRFQYDSNDLVSYTLRGIHIKVKVLWNYEAPGGDTLFTMYKGTNSRVEVRHGQEQNYKPELYVVPNRTAQKAPVLAALKKKVDALQVKYPGIAIQDLGQEILVTIPDQYRGGQFARLTAKFLEYLRNPESVPAWEKASLLAKYYTTTQGLETIRKN